MLSAEHISVASSLILAMLFLATTIGANLRLRRLRFVERSMVHQIISLQKELDDAANNFRAAAAANERLLNTQNAILHENKYLASKVDFTGHISGLDVLRSTFSRVFLYEDLGRDARVRVAEVVLKPFAFRHTMEIDENVAKFAIRHIAAKMAEAFARNIREQITEHIVASWVKAEKN